MFKMTNEELTRFDNSIIGEMMNDNKRHFPSQVVLQLTEILPQIPIKLNSYSEMVKKIIEDNGGKIADKGQIIAEDEDRKKIEEKLTALNSEKVDIVGEKILAGDWGLSFPETVILRPLLAKR